MKATLTVGLESTARIDVDRERTIGFMGEGARVYATPMLVGDIEATCRELLRGHLDPGEDSVGTRVEIDHLAPTLIGMPVEITVRVAEVNGRAVVFEVSARDALDTICRGRESRRIVDMNATEARPRAEVEKPAVA